MTIFIVIAIALLFLSVDAYVQHLELKREGNRRDVRARSPFPARPQNGVILPSGARIGPRHVWVRPSMFGSSLEVGADQFATTLLGFPETLTFAPRGRVLAEGDVIASLRKGGRVLELRTPIAGTVERVNEALQASPSKLGSKPFEQNWLVRVRPTDAADTAKVARIVKTEKTAQRWFEEEMKRLREIVGSLTAIDPLVGATALDGGLPVDGLASALEDDAWEEIVTQFFGGEFPLDTIESRRSYDEASLDDIQKERNT